uniref:Uncharacterized protein n=1 Tax=Nelumbo nucifera TaxID=4432 RepID=A0A822YH79_NELNU|nr:TPA_asm: hypothetical protein HUJ06_030286 [Nelumbo nucifera]
MFVAGMFKRIVVVLLAGLSAWLYQATVPPPPKICGTPGGPPVTSPRIRLSDGRLLAYRETGVPKQDGKYKIIVVHGFSVCKDLELPFPQVIPKTRHSHLCIYMGLINLSFS